MQNVDEFSPDEGLDASFLDDVKDSKAVPTSNAEHILSDRLSSHSVI